MNKKTLTVLMAAAMALTTAPAAFAMNGEDSKPLAPQRYEDKEPLKKNAHVSYSDIDSHFAGASIMRLANYDMIKSKRDGAAESFNPAGKVSREELAAWAKSSIGADLKAASAGSDVTRLEIATLIASTLPPMNTGINGANLKAPYTDIEGVTQEERAALDLLYKVGIMVGDGQGHFNPKAALTRGEAAALLDRSLAGHLSVASKVAFETVQGDLPETVYTVEQENKTEPGVYTVQDKGDLYLVVVGGEAPTPGYSVLVDGVVETQAGIFVSASMKRPDPGMIVAQVITYPTAVLKVKNSEKSAFLRQ